METIEAIYEHGVFRPMQPVVLPESSHVHLQIINDAPINLDDNRDMDAIYEILDKRFNSGHRDTAERHNEHQP